MKKANSQAGKFVSWVSEYDFKVTESSYGLLKQGRHAIWGYDRKMRPVVFLDLFEIDSDNINDLVTNAHLLLSLAYSKM